MASTRSAAVTSGRTSPAAMAASRRSVSPRERTWPNRSSSLACRVGSVAISATSPGSAARAAGVVSTPAVRRTISRTSPASEPGLGKLGRLGDREHRLVHQVRLARPAPVDRRLARACPPGDRVDRQVGVSRLAEQFDRRTQHRVVDARISGSTEVCCHYETQSNISRRDRMPNCSRRPPRRPRRAPLQPGGTTDPRHDGDDGTRVPARRRRTARQGRRRHRPRRLRRRRLPRASRRVSRCAARDSRHACGRHRQPPRAAAAVAEEPVAAHRPADPASRRSTTSSCCHPSSSRACRAPAPRICTTCSRLAAPTFRTCPTGRATSRSRCRRRRASSRIRARRGWTSPSRS